MKPIDLSETLDAADMLAARKNSQKKQKGHSQSTAFGLTRDVSYLHERKKNNEISIDIQRNNF